MRALPLIAAGLLASAASAGPLDLFADTGKSPRHTYRIPTLAVTRQGTLLAVAELRRNGAGDSGDIDTVVKRSTDDGKTWPLSKLIQPGDAAYSHLAILPDGTIALAYETSGYKRIIFTTLKPGDWDSP